MDRVEYAEMDKSKIPVYSSLGQNTSRKSCSADTNVPCAKKVFSQKIVLPLFSKDPNIIFTGKVPKGALSKATDRSKQQVPVSQRQTNRWPATRNKVEEELRDRNQLLEAGNRHLHIDLIKAQETLKDLRESKEILESDVAELNKRLERSMLILENRNIDPVTGNIILDSIEDTDKCRAETKLLTESLLEELKSFADTACEQSKQLLAMKSMCRAAEAERSNFLEKHKAFQEEKENFRMSLKQWTSELAATEQSCDVNDNLASSALSTSSLNSY